MALTKANHSLQEKAEAWLTFHLVCTDNSYQIVKAEVLKMINSQKNGNILRISALVSKMGQIKKMALYL